MGRIHGEVDSKCHDPTPVDGDKAALNESRVYEPASGRVVTVPRDRFVDHELALAGWDEPWFAVLDRR